MSAPIHIDVVIISYARNAEYRKLTEQTLSTLLASESPEKFHFHICVVESDKQTPDYSYPDTVTIRPEVKFGYHTYLNIGARALHSPWICLANNDLYFHPGWATEIFQAIEKYPEIKSAGTWCEDFHPRRGVSPLPPVQFGYENGTHVTGWCLLLNRKIYDDMGGLDEHFSFWYCDDDYRMTLKSMGIKHALVTTARVDHITSQTTIKLDAAKFREMTLWPNLYFDFKWNHRSYPVYLLKKLILWFKIKWNLVR